MRNTLVKKLLNFWLILWLHYREKMSSISKKRLNFPQKIGSRFLLFWAKVLVSPLYIAQLIRETLQEKRNQRRTYLDQPKKQKYLITPYWKRKQATARGFILPTVTMVLLVFSLVVSSLLLRTSQQTQQVAGTRATQATYNIATPAIDRAKSKLEFLFKRDPRFIGVPNETAIERWLINPPTARTGWVGYAPYLDESETYTQIYDLPGETRIDINSDNLVDNAWAYNTDIDGDGTAETVAYSILVKHQNLPTNPTVTLDSSDANKAASLVTRSGPLSIQSADNSSTCSRSQTPDSGWYPINTATVRKNFQVNVVVVNRNAANRAVTSAEFQQDRQLDTGNKWGVWFRYDLEAFPGPQFNWNGAMHTDGNIMWGDTNGNEVGISAYLVSAPSSCLYTQDASEITMTQLEDRSGRILFQGQVINTSPANNDFRGRSEVDIFPGPGITPSGSTTPPSRALNLSVSTNTASNLQGDSVRDNLQTNSPYDFSLDPIPLFTEDRSLSRYTPDLSNQAVRDPNWVNNNLSRRIINKLVRRPYVDDTYRADDRWGPKPQYTDTIRVANSSAYGNLITTNVDILTKEDPLLATPDDVGLDGYWERRARVQGLRIIVGQRLELGNTFGWMGNNDPLYPPNTNLTNLVRQRKSVRDNLAAVQSTLIYHYDSQENSENGRDFPVATLASTVHNGTSVIRNQSRTFTNLRDTGRVNADFLNGLGTNGWEFNAPGNVTNQTDFATLIDQSTDPLRIALNNLSRLAGDSRGAFPARQETGGTIIHPYPLTSMWGDFSNLRRALNRLNTVAYADLSLADRTTIQTAASTIGLLAYNLDTAKQVYDGAVTANATAANNITLATNPQLAGLADLGTQLWRLIDGDPSNGEVNQLISSPVNFPINPADTVNFPLWRNSTTSYTPTITTLTPSATPVQGYTAFYAQFTPEQYIETLNNTTTTNNAPITDDARRNLLVERARQVINYRQVERDRLLGFNTGLLPIITPTTDNIVWNALPTTPNVANNTGTVTTGTGPTARTFRSACDPDEFPITAANSRIALAAAFCPTQMLGTPSVVASVPKYPALYYLFPKQNHDQIGNNFDGAGTVVVNASDDQPATEEYIADTYIFNADPAVTLDINHGFIYRVVGDTDSNGRENGTENGIATLALQPRVPTAWRLPHTTANTRTENSINDNGTTRYLAFLDKAFYNGRQLLQERVLDIDLNLLRSTPVRGGVNPDFWMSRLGIIYAFREDALREDALLRPRPATRTFANCNEEAELLSANCYMVTNPTAPQDPPNSTASGISTKPVDFYPDPDRRSHGFRLKNGSDISRAGTEAGFSLISDNPVYIQGNLNIHQRADIAITDPPTLVEEFTQTLQSNWSNFYTRTTRNDNFARPDRDRWRPVEVLGDALTILSNNFCDGTMEDGFRNNNGDCPTGQVSSYRNSVLAWNSNNSAVLTGWHRENKPNLASDDNLIAPIRLDRNGVVRRNNADFNQYRNLSQKTIGDAVTSRVNAIFINGLVPSRPNQSYGGLHNFPRFIENWGGDDLHIAGAFVQLNFSTYATAPWEQEAWEPGQAPGTGENIGYYNPPNRRWGYDVALQYVRPGPIANRFVSVGSPRNEFYKQIPADDPYSRQLRCSRVGTNGPRVDPNATDCP